MVYLSLLTLPPIPPFSGKLRPTKALKYLQHVVNVAHTTTEQMCITLTTLTVKFDVNTEKNRFTMATQIHNFFELSTNFDLPPEAAIRHLQNKGLKATLGWMDTIGEEHDAVFTVAKMMDTGLLSYVQEQTQRAIDTGVTGSSLVFLQPMFMKNSRSDSELWLYYDVYELGYTYLMRIITPNSHERKMQLTPKYENGSKPDSAAFSS